MHRAGFASYEGPVPESAGKSTREVLHDHCKPSIKFGWSYSSFSLGPSQLNSLAALWFESWIFALRPLDHTRMTLHTPETRTPNLLPMDLGAETVDVLPRTASTSYVDKAQCTIWFGLRCPTRRETNPYLRELSVRKGRALLGAFCLEVICGDCRLCSLFFV